MTSDLPRSALEAAEAIAAGRLTSEALVRACLDRVAVREPEVQAWAWIDAERALAEARARDAEAPRSPLHGIPVGVKDVLDTCDMPTGYGSPIYEGYRAGYDAACVSLARAAGMVVLGKTVTTEFAMRQPGKTRNPHNRRHTPGGSSSGSAAAVAAGMVPLAIGTQTAGSVIRPASYCGVVGYKPTYGRIPRAGVKLLAESLDTLGVMARSVADAAAFAAILERTPVTPLPSLERPPRFGLCRTPAWREAEPATQAAMERAADLFRKAGGTVTEIALPEPFAEAPQAQNIIMSYEMARMLAYEREEHREKLSAALRQVLNEGRMHTRERYDRARGVQAACRAAMVDVLDGVDVLLSPAAPGEAPHGLGSTGSPAFNRIWTLLGVPCVTVPGLAGPHRLPVGIQLVGAAGRAAHLLACAQWAERELR